MEGDVPMTQHRPLGAQPLTGTTPQPGLCSSRCHKLPPNLSRSLCWRSEDGEETL